MSQIWLKKGKSSILEIAICRSSTHLARTLKTLYFRWDASMPYAVKLSSYKIDEFFPIFRLHQEMRRLGYLKSSPCKGSRSELFPLPLPLTGMETVEELVVFIGSAFPLPLPLTGMETIQPRLKMPCRHKLSITTSPNGDGNFKTSTLTAFPVISVFPLPLPLTGMETLLSHRLGLGKTLQTFHYHFP